MKADIVVQNTNPAMYPSPAATQTKPIKLITCIVEQNKQSYNTICIDCYVASHCSISHAKLSCRSMQSLSIYSTCQGRSLRWRLVIVVVVTLHCTVMSCLPRRCKNI